MLRFIVLLLFVAAGHCVCNMVLHSLYILWCSEMWWRTIFVLVANYVALACGTLIVAFISVVIFQSVGACIFGWKALCVSWELYLCSLSLRFSFPYFLIKRVNWSAYKWYKQYNTTFVYIYQQCDSKYVPRAN